MIVADSSFLVALFLPNDANHDGAVEKFSQILDKVFIPNIILYETLTVINYKGGSEEKRTAYNKIINNKSFVIGALSNDELAGVLEDFLSYNSKLSFEDTAVVSLATKLKTSTLDFDEGIMKTLKSAKSKSI